MCSENTGNYGNQNYREWKINIWYTFVIESVLNSVTHTSISNKGQKAL
jgi:hypothetical protein